jgi:uncharacterized repeat protein (TIGR01451 family)
VTTSADLAITKHTATSSVAKGGFITYQISITNYGPGAAQNVVLKDKLPTGVTFVSQTQNSGPSFSLTNTDTQIVNTLAKLDANCSVSFTVVARVSGSVARWQKLVNTVTIASDSSDPKSSNNSSTATTTVNSTTRPPCQNPGEFPFAYFDVDCNGKVNLQDLLILLDRLKRFGIGNMTSRGNNDPYFDINGDGLCSPADAGLLIDHLNRHTSDEASGLLSSFESSEGSTATAAPGARNTTTSQAVVSINAPRTTNSAEHRVPEIARGLIFHELGEGTLTETSNLPVTKASRETSTTGSTRTTGSNGRMKVEELPQPRHEARSATALDAIFDDHDATLTLASRAAIDDLVSTHLTDAISSPQRRL